MSSSKVASGDENPGRPTEHPDAVRGVDVTMGGVATGASYSLFPRRILEQLGIRPIDQDEFTLADGRKVKRDVAVASVRLDGRVRPTVCVVGDEGTKPLLGAITLKAFGLAADPINRRLVKAPLYLL